MRLTSYQALDTKTSDLFVTIELHQAEYGPQDREGSSKASGGIVISNISCIISDGRDGVGYRFRWSV